MKGMEIMGWKLGLAALVLLFVGVITVLRLGTKRGTKMYRTRMALWALAVGLLAGGAVVAGASGASAEIVADVSEDETDVTASPDASVEDDMMVTCYCTVSPHFRR